MPKTKPELRRGKKTTDTHKRVYPKGHSGSMPAVERVRITQNAPTYNFDGLGFIDKYFYSESFRNIVDSGKYIFLDGKIVLKSKSCLQLSDDGLHIYLPKNDDLTAYCSNLHRSASGVSIGKPARAKIGNSTRFNKRGRAWNFHPLDTDFPGVKITDPRGKVIVVGHGTHQRYSHSIGVFRLAKSWRESFEEAKKISSLKDITTSNLFLFMGGGQEPPHNFADALIFFMEERNVTVECLAEETGLSEKTIQRLRNSSGGRPDLKTVIAICVGLHLDAYSGDTLLHLAGYILTNKKCDKMYRLFINFAFKETVFECNNALIRCGLKPLTNLHN